MKWKHWAYYLWLDGEIMRVSRPMESDDSQKEEIEIPIRTLADFLENQPEANYSESGFGNYDGFASGHEPCPFKRRRAR